MQMILSYSLLQLVIEVLSAYEIAFGQLINKANFAVYMHPSTSIDVVNKVKMIIGIGMREFPFTYLGCPIFYTRKKWITIKVSINKILDKLQY